MTRHDLTDEQWALVEPLLPPQKPRTGRPARNHREVLNGILWIARTGAPWRDLPERYGAWQTVYSRLRHWSREGIWQRVFEALLAEAQRRQDLDWNLHHIDSTVIRAHQHAAGAQKKGTLTPPAGRS